jgi:CheY-like chemotaxis protein
VTADSSAAARQHVLVVEDDRAVRESLRRSLEFNGYQVSTASDGAEALAGISGINPDAVVMDVMMPRLDGLETTRALRKVGNGVPILVLASTRVPTTTSPSRSPSKSCSRGSARSCDEQSRALRTPRSAWPSPT